MRITPPLKWHGGKHYLAARIIEKFAPHVHYVEPFAGGLSVLLAKNPDGVSEVVNDLNGDLANFWCTLQSADAFRDFCRVVQAVPFSESEFAFAKAATVFDTDTDRAVNFFVACRQSLAGRMQSFTGITKTRTRRGMNNEVSAWLSAVEGLPLVHARLKRVLILNRPALEVVRGHDGPQVLQYLDPPYIHASRATTGEYAHEMTDADHRELLATITDPAIKGKFALSGYDNPLYAERLASWNRHEFEIANHSAGGASKRRMVEVLWTNY